MKNQKSDKIVSTTFFTKKEYDKLKNTKLPIKDYKSFIETCNRRIAKELIVENKGGWEMPFNLGKLQIHKNFNLKGGVNRVTGEVYPNYHTLGFIFKCRLWRDGRRSTYTPKYLKSIEKAKTQEVPIMFYKWNNHRYNIDRYMAKLLKENSVDFEELKK